MKRYRTFDEVEESYFRDHPEEVDSYTNLILEDHAKNGDTAALASSLHILQRAKTNPQ